MNYYERHNTFKSLCSNSLPLFNKLNLEYQKEAIKADSFLTPKSCMKDEFLGMDLLKMPNSNSSHIFSQLMNK